MSLRVLLIHPRRRTVCLRTLLVAIVLVFASTGWAAEFIPLGMRVSEISDDGRVVMGWTFPGGSNQTVVRWTGETGTVPLYDFPRRSSRRHVYRRFNHCGVCLRR